MSKKRCLLSSSGFLRRQLLMLCLPSICTFSAIAGQDEGENVDDLFSLSIEELTDLTVISATRAEINLKQSPVPVSVITAKDISNSGLDNVPDILARLAEIDVMHVGQSQTEVSIRGKNINFNRRLLVMIDGRTEYNDLFGATLWHALPIAVDDIARIEVVRGPASALFGANAYAGVINIITKAPDGKNVQGVKLQWGSDAKRYAHLALKHFTEHHQFKLSYSIENADSQDQEVNFAGFNQFPSHVNFANDSNSLNQLQRVNFQWQTVLTNDLDLHFAAAATDGELELLMQPGLPRDKWQIKTYNAQLKLDYAVDENSRLEWLGYVNAFDYYTELLPQTEDVLALTLDQGEAFFPSLDQATGFSGQVDTLDMSLQYVDSAFDNKLMSVIGTEYRQIDNHQGLVADSKKHINSLFANFSYRFDQSQWIAALAVRADDDSVTGTDFAYNASLHYFINDNDSVRLSVRRAFRAPSLFELYADIDMNVVNQNHRVRLRGNPALSVETIDSIDLTYRYRLNVDTELSFELFYERYHQLIGNPDSGLLSDVELNPQTNLFITTTSYQNLGSASSKGLQASLVWLAAKKINFYSHYRYAKPNQLNNLPGETFFSPKHTVKLGATWQLFNGISADFGFQYNGKTDPEEFASGNVAPDGFNFTRANQQSWQQYHLTLRYRPQAIEGLALYLTAYNLFDHKRVEYYEYDSVLNGVGERMGRAWWGGVTWHF